MSYPTLEIPLRFFTIRGNAQGDDAHNTGVGAFNNPFDPSGADTASGFTYFYDFDNDGTFDLTTSDSSAIVPASYLDDDANSPRVVATRIEDKNGAGTNYTTEITINGFVDKAN